MISARERGGRSALDIIGTRILVGKIKIKPLKEIIIKVLVFAFLQIDLSLRRTLAKENKLLIGPGCKESQFFSLPFGQAVASMY